MKQLENLKKIMLGEIKYDNLFDSLDDLYNVKLPIDYKLMLKLNSEGGYVNDFIHVLDLYSEYDRVAQICLAYRISKNKFPDYFIHSTYPDANGILPCAITENGDEIYWLTSDNDWSLIVYESRSPDYYEYKMSLSEFIYKIICKEIICPAFPDDL